MVSVSYLMLLQISKTTATLSESETELHAKQTEKEGLRQELNEMKSQVNRAVSLPKISLLLQVAALEERLSQVDEPPEVDPEIGAIEKQIENLQSQVSLSLGRNLLHTSAWGFRWKSKSPESEQRRPSWRKGVPNWRHRRNRWSGRRLN